MTIRIPFEHCVSKRDKITRWRDGRIALSDKYANAKLAINYIGRAQFRQKPFEGPVEMVGVCWFPDRRRRDIHNYIQAIADGLEGICYANDNQVKRLVWEFGGVDKDEPRIEITVTPTEAR
ncbi:MAG: RusA family crossover junction endodeoxyribonuclease [Planctomycetes bacterium]|nr:RusA family crossover junction endodeoxyribonuclease [Planctomycetota bacterium]